LIPAVASYAKTQLTLLLLRNSRRLNLNAGIAIPDIHAKAIV
jgi:hypothetical protein